MTTPEELVQLAKDARSRSYVPYSGFAVGAALLCKDGTVYQGCNIENAAYGPSNCAERTAIFKAVSEGVRSFEAIAIVGGAENEKGETEIKDFCPPCGVCRQVMSEFCGKDFKIILFDGKSSIKEFTLAELLPESFNLL